MNTSVDISVVICTFNRASMLQDTLESYMSMAKTCSCSAELLIVDNHSTDATAAAAQGFLSQHALGRYVFEPQAGLSHARNAGIRAADAEIIAFVDDDVYFEPGWTDAIVSAFRTRPEADCVGGNTVPAFESDTPAWLHPSIAYVYGSTDSGQEPHWMQFPEHPFGVNMAFRRSALLEMGGFDTRLGRIRDNLLSSEETLLFWRMNESGRRCWYTSDARLQHRIPTERTSHEWVLRRSHWQGISDVILQQIIAPKAPAALIGNSASEILRLIRSLAGNNFSPRKIYWYYLKLPFYARVVRAYRIGKIRQSLHEVFLSNKKYR